MLYGSSALNGVINIRTQYPKDKPVTKINVSNGFYMPGYGSRKGTSLLGGDSILDQRGDQTWWDKPQGYIQGNFTHLRKLTENDELVLGGSFMKDQVIDMEQMTKGQELMEGGNIFQKTQRTFLWN